MSWNKNPINKAPDLVSIFQKEMDKNIDETYEKIINDNKNNKKLKDNEINYSLDNDIEAIKNIYWETNKVFDTFKKDLFWNWENKINLQKIKEKKEENSDKSLKTWKDNDKENFKINVKYFNKNKNDKLAGFNGIAWMDNLKKELQKDFIKPIQLKLKIDKIKNKKNKTKKDKEILDLFKDYENLKINIPTWFLMYGPPWTGKTFITKKLAEELEANFISQTMGDLGSSYQHQTTQNIKKLFDESKKISEKWPTILFLDEIDSLVSARTDRVDANKAEEISQFLQEFNKLAEEAPNLIVIAATNRPDHLDPALLRSWRFDKKIYVGPPDEITREKMFQLFINKTWRPNDWNINFKKLAKLTDWYVTADIENIVKEASRNVWENILDLINEKINWTKNEKNKSKNKILTQKELEEAIKKIPSSIALTDMSIYDKWNKKMNSI